MNGTLPESQRDVPAGQPSKLSPLEAQKLHHLAAPLKAMLREHHPIEALKILTVLTTEVIMEVGLQDPADTRASLYADFSKGIAASIDNEVAHRARRPM